MVQASGTSSCGASMRYFATSADPLYVVHSVDRRLAVNHLPELHGRVLDLGAGDQPFRDLLPDDADYVAVDRAPGNGIVLCCDACALPFAAETFDGVLCTEVIEHVPAPWLAVLEIARCLRPGGRVYLTAPMNWHLHYEPHDFFRFTRYGIESLLRGAGLEVIAVERGGGMFTAACGKATEAVWGSVIVPALRRTAHPWGLYRLMSRILFPLSWIAALACRSLDRLFPRDTYIWAVTAEKPGLVAIVHDLDSGQLGSSAPRPFAPLAPATPPASMVGVNCAHTAAGGANQGTREKNRT